MSTPAPAKPRLCHFCRRPAEWNIRGIDESTGDDVSVLACNLHRGKTGRMGPVVLRYRQRLGSMELDKL